MNSTFLKACRCQPVDYTPVWMMRQAGRYLPEYHTVRKNYSFLDMCRTPAAAVEVTMQPVDLIGVDAAILFSDILVLPMEMGARLEFQEKKGPVFLDPIRDESAVDRLVVPDPEERLGYVLAAIRELRRELANKVPLIGFAGAPFTVATYLIEGGSSKNFFLTKKMMYTAPKLFSALMEKLSQATIDYLKAQAAAGAQALQLFDSWAGVLAPRDFAEFALPYSQKIFHALKQSGIDIPLIYFANNGATLLPQSRESGADVLGLDWRVNIDDAAKITGPNIALQGNLDPCALLLPAPKLEERVAGILKQAKSAPGHIFNLGHGILPEIPPAQAKLLVELVHRLSKK